MKNPGVSNGLYLGGAGVVLYFATYFFSPKFMLSSGGWFVFLLSILFMVKAAREEKASFEGYASFGELLKPTMITFTIGTLIATLAQWVLINFIDPSLIDVMKDIAIEGIEKAGEFLGGDFVDEAKDEILDNDSIGGIGTTIMGWAFGLIIPGLILSLIISAILKNNREDSIS